MKLFVKFLFHSPVVSDSYCYYSLLFIPERTAQVGRELSNKHQLNCTPPMPIFDPILTLASELLEATQSFFCFMCFSILCIPG